MSKDKWTWLIYIAAHNDLDEYGKAVCDKVCNLGSSTNVNVIILLDSPKGAELTAVGSTPDDTPQWLLGDFNAGDPQRLIDVARWAYTHHPAERYALVLWSHGNGWTPDEIGRLADEELGNREIDETRALTMPGRRALFRTTLQKMFRVPNPSERAICFDDGTHQALDTLALEHIMSELHNSIGQKLDLLAMDACLMASIEVAYELRNHVSVMLAAAEPVPATSGPYDKVLSKLYAQPNMDAAALASMMVDEYVDYYRIWPPGLGNGDITQIVLDLSRVDTLAQAMRAWAEAIITDMPAALPCLEQAQTETYTIETVNGRRGESKFIYHLWDILSMANHLAGHCSAASVRATSQQVVNTFCTSDLVVHAGHLGKWLDAAGGLNVYWKAPKRRKPRHISRYYPEVAFARDAQWQAMLEAYRYTP